MTWHRTPNHTLVNLDAVRVLYIEQDRKTKEWAAFGDEWRLMRGTRSECQAFLEDLVATEHETRSTT